ncbi:MAG: diguanylate cyclase [Bryobacteraceae bacterium]
MQILVADDSPVFRDMLKRMLPGWGYEVILAEDGQQAWEHLKGNQHLRLAILDWMMPGMEGAEVCRRVRSSIRDRYIYVLLLSVRSDSEDIVEGMESGADDYIVKPFQMDELRARLRAGRRVLALQEELIEAREALREQAARDPLTGLWNRRAIFDILQKELARAERSQEALTVLMADLDGFKAINDKRGHAAGDSVLRQVAARMQATMRRYDSVGRYGGEEFLIVLPGCDLTGALAQAERIRSSIAADPFSLAQSQVNLTCSLGVACTDNHGSSELDLLVQQADAALYRAKHLGGDRVESAKFDAAAVS